MPLTQINNGDSGLVARTAINAAISAVDDLTLQLPQVAYVTTTTAATTSIAVLSMGTYSTYTIEATIAAKDTSNQLVYGSQLFAVFNNTGLSVTQVSTTDVYEKSDFTTATSHIILDTDPKIVVVGENSKTIEWTTKYEITKI